MYRILLSDSETTAAGDAVNIVGTQTVSSSATAVDSFANTEFTGCHYVVVGYNATEGSASTSEVTVVASDADAFVTGGPSVSTKGTDQLTFTAALAGTTVTLSAASTAGGSTVVNAYRVQLLRGVGGASTTNTVLVNTTQTITGQKTFSSEVVLNSISSADSTAVQINDGLTVGGAFTANTIQTNNISSSESSAIQINDGVNISGALTVNTLKTDSTATISGTLTANTIVTNDISSADSTAVQINDGVNVSGTLTANTLVTNNISSSESSAIQINDAVYVGGQIQATGGWAGTVSSAGKLGGIVQAFNCERSGTGSIGGILSYGNGLATGKGLRMPFAGKLLAATVAGTAIVGTVTLDAYLNESANSSYRLTQTNASSGGVGVTQDFQSSPLSFAAGDFLGWYQTAVPSSANGYSVSYYVIFD
jgi:hypothetical protein